MHRKIFGVVILFVLVLTALPVALAQPGGDKIEPRLLDKFAADGTAGFIVHFVEQADLSPAKTMNWADSGEFVYNTLKATAARSQAATIAYLDSLGLYHETYIAGNELYVRAGTLDVATNLAARPEVASILAQRTYYVDPILAVASKAPQALDWGIVDTNADQFWTTFGLQGDGIKVSSIDTGVQWNHPALDQAFACPGDPTNAACWDDPSNICGVGGACDNAGHGTHTMGTMVGDDDPSLTYQVGMAPNATWIACKGCESSSCSDTALNACADWILAPGGNTANRPNVVNNSWGGSGCETWYLAKVQAWVAAGIFPAFSAGNSGSSCTTLGSPGAYQDSFASAAHDSSRTIAGFSSRGPNYGGGCAVDPYTKPNISAPGVSICSSVPTNAWDCSYSGTSMASPHTAGAVALLWSCAPALVGQIDATFQLLQSTADAPPAGSCGASPHGGNYTYGYGYLNVLAAGIQVCGGVALGALDGYVRDTGNNPIAGATVSAVPGVNGGTINALTDPAGYYTMTLVVGTYNVTALKTGYAPQTVNGIVVTEGNVTSQDFQLTYLGMWTPSTQPNCFDWTRMDSKFYAGTGKVYILGGRGGPAGDQTFGNIIAFDPVANTCVDTGAVMTTPISNYTIAVVNDGTNDLLCTFGGRDSAGVMSNVVQCYNPNTNVVVIKAPLPTAFDTFMVGGIEVLNNKVYLFGGFRNTASPYNLNITYEYDPVTNAYTAKGNMPLGLGYILTAAVDNYVYGFGGDIFDGASLIAQTIAERYDPVAGTWSDAAVADLPVAGDEGRGFGFDSDSIFPYQNQIVLATMAQWSGDSAAVILYDVATNSYDQTFPDLNVPIRNHGGTIVPLCSADPADGLPAMWVIGGRAGADTPPYHGPEFYPMACPTAPIASFDSSSPDCLGETTVFTDTSAGNPTEWAWDFGDSGISDVQNPTHLYATAGDFVVTLVATNTEGSGSVTGTVTINGLPDASFVYAPHAGLMPLTVYFTATGSNVMTPTWEFGDTGTGTGWTIQHTYVATGTYPVTMTAVGLCGTIVQTGEVIVTFEMAPVASFTADPMTGCGAPLVVHFTDTSMAVPPVTEWFWDFGDAVGTSMEQNPVYTYTTTGDFVVTLLVTSTLGSDSVTDTISVYDLPVATFDYAPAVGNAPLTVYFTDTSMFGGDPIWDFGDATFGAGATVTHTYAATGTYTVILTTTSPLGCGDATATGIVQVNAPGTCIPVNIVSVDQTPAGCVVGFAATLTGDAPFTYLWDFGTFGTFTTTTATVNFGATGTYTGTLDVWNCTAGHDMEPISVDVDCMPAPVFKIYLPLVYRGY